LSTGGSEIDSKQIVIKKIRINWGEENGGKDEGVANTYIGYLGLFYMKLANLLSRSLGDTCFG
jgi:hypothetical protein